MRSDSVPISQRLNAADCLMLSAHNSLREIGHSGFHCQTHLWLSERLDVRALKNALTCLSLRYPVMTSRLVDPGGVGEPYWKFRSGAPSDLHEVVLDRSDTHTVWRYASDLFATSLDHDRIDPVAFHVLHLPDGRDVLLMRFSHVLMDGKAPELVLEKLDCCYETNHGRQPIQEHRQSRSSRPCENGQAIAAHLNSFKRLRRYRAALRVVGDHLCTPAKSVKLFPWHTSERPMESCGIELRSLDESQTKAVMDRAKRLCGFVNLTPALLASIFRAVRRRAHGKNSMGPYFRTDVPLTLRSPGGREPVFSNLISFIQLRAKSMDMDDRDHLTRLLHSQMRNQLSRRIDLGNLQLMTILSRHRWLLRKYIAARILKYPSTLDFCLMGPVTEGLERFCGRTVDWLYTLNTTTSPQGVALQVNLFRGRMNLAMTYVSESMSEDLASAFLDTIVEDLIKK